MPRYSSTPHSYAQVAAAHTSGQSKDQTGGFISVWATPNSVQRTLWSANPGWLHEGKALRAVLSFGLSDVKVLRARTCPGIEEATRGTKAAFQL